MRNICLALVFLAVTFFLLNPFSHIDMAVSDIGTGGSRGGFPDNLDRGRVELRTEEFPSPVLGKEEYAGEMWDVLTMEGAVPQPFPGQPRIPVIALTVEDPRIIESMEVRYFNPSAVPMRLVPHPRVLSPYSEESVEYVDSETYSESMYLPEEEYRLTLLGGSWRDGVRHWKYSLALYPVRYNPVMEMAIIYEKAEVEIEFSAVGDTMGDGEIADEHHGASSGYSAATRNTGTRGASDPKYLMITPSQFTGSLESLAQWKTKKGVPCEIHACEDIYDDYSGSDNPEKIRNFIKDMHREYNIKYVLLAGDYGQVPVRRCKDPDPAEGWDDGWIPADSYYACLDGTWNRDGDGYWGENGDITDIIADVAVSRIAINSHNKMRSWAQSIINYEKSPPGGNWMEKAVLIGADTHQTGDGARQCDYLQDNYLHNTFGTPVEFYENGGTIDRNTLRSDINDGVGYVNFVDHGGPVTWCQNGGNQVVFDINDVVSLSNGGRRPLVSAMACLTNWFDNPSGCGYQNFVECIGEYFTENDADGAIAYIGSSRSAIGVIGTNQYYYGAGGLQEDLCLQLGNGNLHMGDTHHDGKNRYANSFGNWFAETEQTKGEIQACWLEFNMLGEPEVPLWTEVPEHFGVGVSTSPQWINVTVNESSNGEPVKDALICIQGQDRYQRALTDGDGKIRVPNPLAEGMAQITVTKPNFIPHETSERYVDITPPDTHYSVDPAEPTGTDGWYNTTTVLTLTSEELSTIRYSVTDEETGYMTYRGPVTVPDGTEFVYYLSEDIWGNVEPRNRLELKVDTSAPVTSMLLDPETPTGTGSWYVTPLSARFETDEEVVDTYYRIVPEDGQPRDGFIKYTGEIYLQEEGSVILEFYSIDRAGNMEELSGAEILIDRTPPEVEVVPDEDPDGNDGWYTEPPGIAIVSSSPDDIIYYHFDDDDPVLYTRPVEPKEGCHIFHCFSMDQAGNTGSGMEMEFKVDSTPPEVLCLLDPEYPDGLGDFYLNVPEIGLESEENSTIYYNWNGGEYAEYLPGEPIDLPAEGMVELGYYAVDPAGNTGPVASTVLQIDSTAPVTTAELDPSEPDGNDDWYTELEIILRTGARDLKAIYYYFDTQDDLEKYRGPISGDDIPEGAHTLYYYSTDRAGNHEKPRSIDLKFDQTPPKVLIRVIGNGAKTGEEIEFQAFSCSDDCGIAAYKIDYGDGKAGNWNKAEKFTHAYSKGKEYEVTLWVRDMAGHVSRGTVDVTVKEKSTMEKFDDYRKENPDTLPAVIAVVIIIVLVMIVLVIARKRSKKRRAERDEQAEGGSTDEADGPDKRWAPSSEGSSGFPDYSDPYSEHPIEVLPPEKGTPSSSPLRGGPVADHDMYGDGAGSDDGSLGTGAGGFPGLSPEFAALPTLSRDDENEPSLPALSQGGGDNEELLALPAAKTAHPGDGHEAEDDFSLRVTRFKKAAGEDGEGTVQEKSEVTGEVEGGSDKAGRTSGSEDAAPDGEMRTLDEWKI